MASIDSLNFEVILNDTNFRNTIAADKKLAQGFNTELTKFLSVRPRVLVSKTGVDNASQLLGYLTQIQSRMANMPKGAFLVSDANQLNATLQQILPKLDQMIAKTGSAKAGFAGMNSTLSGTNALMRTLSQLTGAAFSVVGIRRFLSSLLDITGQFEVQRMALRNMLQDVDGADKIFEDLYRFSSDSTYRFSELAKYAKQLAAFNIDKDGLLETTKMLGDVASGVGVSMDRLILAYGHVKSSGFLRGIQLRSFSQNGVPVLDELAKMFSELEHRAVSLGEVFDKMTKREIPFEMVEQAFKNMTSEGGKFYQMQEVLAKTLAGQMNILKGRWENMLAALGQANSGPIKDMVAGVSNLIANYENVGRVLKELIITFGAYKAALFVVTAVSEGLFAASFNLLLMLEKIEAAILANPYAILAAAIAAAGYALYKFNNYMTDAEKITKTAKESEEKYRASLAAETAELDRLFARLKLAKEGTEEYDKARLAIENRFGPYLQQIRSEQGAIDNLADTYDTLAEKIKKAQQAKFLESESDTMRKVFQDASSNIYESFKKTAEVNKWSIDQQEDIWRYIVTGELTNKDYQKNLGQIGGGTIGLPGTFLYKDMGRSAASLRADYISAAKAYDDGMTALEKVFEKRANSNANGGDKKDDVISYKISVIVDAIKNFDTEIEKLRAKARTIDGITAEEKGQLDTLVEDRKTQADLYKSIMGIDYDKETRKGESAAEKARKKSISDLKTDIALLEKYLSIYQKVEPIEGENTAKWMSENIGGKPEDYANLESQIESICASLRQLGDEGNEAADAIEARLGLDAASKLVALDKAAKKAAEDFQAAEEKIGEYLSKNFGIEGEKVAEKISKLIADLGTKNAGVDGTITKLTNALEKERAQVVSSYLETNKDLFAEAGLTEAQQKAMADSYWQEYRRKRIEEIKAQAAQQKDYNTKVTTESIRNLAKTLFNEQMFGFDMNNWGDKTLSQINAIRDALKTMDVPDDVRKELEGYEEILQALIDELKTLADTTITNTVDPERWKKISKQAKYIAESFLSVANSLKEYADATGNTQLSQAAEAVGAIAQNLQAAEQGAVAWGGWWGAIIGGVTDLITQITEAATATETAAAQLKEAFRQIHLENQINNFKDALELAKNGIFGDNEINELNLAIEKLKEYRDLIANMHGIYAGTNNWLSLYTSSGSYAVQFTQKHETWFNLAQRVNLERIAVETGYDLLDKYGNFNVALLKWIADAGWDLTAEEKDWLDKAIEYSTNYAEAMGVIESRMNELFGNIASSAAETIIDSWIEAKNAALDYADVLDEVARSYAKMLIQSTIIDSALNPLKDDIQEAFISGDYERAMELIAQGMQSVKDAAPIYEAILNAFDPYFKREEEDERDGQSLGAGIKGITEEMASLLASYINAMRADLSFMRTLQEQGWSDVAILGAFIPTLNDYLQQIAANTFDAAQHTESILSELRAVIGAEGSTGMIVRVQMA